MVIAFDNGRERYDDPYVLHALFGIARYNIYEFSDRVDNSVVKDFISVLIILDTVFNATSFGKLMMIRPSTSPASPMIPEMS
jgi:hypothetical protein